MDSMDLVESEDEIVTQESINKQFRITKVKIRSMSNAKHKIVSSYRFNLLDCTRQPTDDLPLDYWCLFVSASRPTYLSMTVIIQLTIL